MIRVSELFIKGNTRFIISQCQLIDRERITSSSNYALTCLGSATLRERDLVLKKRDRTG